MLTPALTAAALLLVFALGYANQRGSTCAVRAADQIILERRFTRIAGFVVAAAMSALMILALGIPVPEARMSGVAAALGGALVALGASLNGRCAMGTVADLSAGNVARLATFGGFFAGALLGHDLGAMAGMKLSISAMQGAPIWVSASLALTALVVAWRISAKAGEASPAWMALIGLLNALLLTIVPHWTYTSRLVALASGQGADLVLLIASLIALVAGGSLAARRSAEWHLRVPPVAAWVRYGVAGVTMGLGAVLIPGGNDTMLLAGVPFMIPHLLLAYASFLATLLLLRYGAARRGIKRSRRS